MSCDWEGNRRSGVALAVRHRLEWFIHLRAQSLSKGDEHPTNTLHGVWYSLPLPLYMVNKDSQIQFMSKVCCRIDVEVVAYVGDGNYVDNDNDV